MTRHIHGPDDEWCEECFGEADAPTETSDTQKDATIAKWRTRAKKFQAACRDADFECFAHALRAACHKDEIKRLRAQAEKDKAEIVRLREMLEGSDSIVEKEV